AVLSHLILLRQHDRNHWLGVIAGAADRFQRHEVTAVQLAVVISDVELEQERVASELRCRAAKHPENVPQPPAFVLARHAFGNLNVLAVNRAGERHRELDPGFLRHLAHIHQNAIFQGLRPGVDGNDFRVVPESLACLFVHWLSPFSMNLRINSFACDSVLMLPMWIDSTPPFKTSATRGFNPESCPWPQLPTSNSACSMHRNPKVRKIPAWH